ncbi:MAG: type II toxin-antitoxin system prevent-host-death family antitoxin [Rickettsiales bacterium]|nr:MAG: type II toxin-antitoxin system prevent-host-death family antitoxin [Rickettsiales bacterium]
MSYLIANETQNTLNKLIDEVALSHKPQIIKGKRNSAVIISVEDWESIQETWMIVSNQKLSDSLIKNMKTPFEECSKELY